MAFLRMSLLLCVGALASCEFNSSFLENFEKYGSYIYIRFRKKIKEQIKTKAMMA